MSWYGDLYNGYDKYLWGGLLPGGVDPNDPAHNGGPYEGVNQGNFQLPFGDDMRRRDNRLGDRATADAGYWQGQQRDVAGNLADQMQGKNSLAQLQLRQAADQNIANQRSMAASAAPGNAALMNLQAMQGAGRINQGYAGQAQQASIMERNAAANALAGLATGARGQSLGQADSGYGRALQAAGMQQQGNIAYEGNRTARFGAAMGAPTNMDNFTGMVKNVATLGGMATGGVVSQPTHALIGEAGPEAVIPLAQLPTLMAQMQQAGVQPQSPSTTAAPVVATRTKTSNGTGPAPRQQDAAGRRGILPGELAKFAPSEASKFVVTPPPPPPLPLGYDLGKARR